MAIFKKIKDFFTKQSVKKEVPKKEKDFFKQDPIDQKKDSKIESVIESIV